VEETGGLARDLKTDNHPIKPTSFFTVRQTQQSADCSSDPNWTVITDDVLYYT
jgi:hypothetical protein